LSIELGEEFLGEPFQIYNQQGQLIRNQQISVLNFNCDLRDLANGVYFIRIGELSERLVIER
tara:strand:+ start:2758 stop:2943 length:186 start_codon:yes stop_codon:yes gene_type:complete